MNTLCSHGFLQGKTGTQVSEGRFRMKQAEGTKQEQYIKRQRCFEGAKRTYGIQTKGLRSGKGRRAPDGFTVTKQNVKCKQHRMALYVSMLIIQPSITGTTLDWHNRGERMPNKHYRN